MNTRIYTFSVMLAIAFLGCNQVEKKESVSDATQIVDIESRLKDLNITLKTPDPPSASFVKTMRTANLVYTSGHGPEKPDGTRVIGKVGADLTIEQG